MPRKSPFDDIESVFDRMNRELEQLGRQLEGEFGGGVDVDVSETDDEVIVAADLPGYDSEDIDVSVSDRDLTISAERAEEHEEADDDRRYHRRERSRRRATRRLRLPADVLEREADAEYNNGVLTVTLPKASGDDVDGTHIDVE